MTGTMDRPQDFRRMLQSITERTTVPWELVVSDASQDPLYTEGLQKNVVVLPERPRLGMTKGYNAAFRQARGEWVIWLNDDAEVIPGYDTAAIRFMEAHPEIGLGALHYADPIIGYHASICCYGMVYANFGILRRTFGNEIGWFDEDLLMYGSDNSIAYRVLLAGKGIGEIPDAQIYHHATDDHLRLANQNYRDREAHLLRAKYGPHLERMRAVYEGALQLQ